MKMSSHKHETEILNTLSMKTLSELVNERNRQKWGYLPTPKHRVKVFEKKGKKTIALAMEE